MAGPAGCRSSGAPATTSAPSSQREQGVRQSATILVGFLETKREVRQADLAAISAAIDDTSQQITELRNPAAADFDRFIERMETIVLDAETAEAAARTAADLSSAIADGTRAMGTAKEGGPTTTSPSPSTTDPEGEPDGAEDERPGSNPTKRSATVVRPPPPAPTRSSERRTGRR